MSTFSLNKTNPRLSGNIKIVIDSKSKMFIESINSSEYLSRSLFKGFEWNNQLAYGTNVRNWCSQFTDINILYDVVDESQFNPNDSFALQYQQIYNWGCYSEESQLVDENMRFLAPIHVGQDSEAWPDLFVVFRVPETQFLAYDQDSPVSHWINEGTLVHVQNLDIIKKSVFSQLEPTTIDAQFDQGIGTVGLNVKTGQWNRAEEDTIEQLLRNETTITEFDNWITNSFKRQGLLYSSIANLEFAFTDSTADNKFARYVGFYVKQNDVDFETLREYQGSGAIRLIQTETGIDKFSQLDEESTYYEQSFSRYANSFGAQKPALLEFKFRLRPALGQEFKILLQDQVEYSVLFTANNIGRNAQETTALLINDINNNYKGQQSTVTAQMVNGWIRLESGSRLGRFNQLSIDVPNAFIVRKPAYDKTSWANNFIGGSLATVVLNEFINPEVYPVLMYLNSAGEKKKSKIVQVSNWKGDWLYKLDEDCDHTVEPDHIWFVKELRSQPILGSIQEHRALDFDQTASDHSEVLDFDLDMYRDWLLDKLASPDHIGDAVNWAGASSESALTATELADYKEVVRSKLLNYFNSISINEEFLYDSVDLLTLQSRTIDNEYKRLQEVDNRALSKSNRLFQYVNKWQYNMGQDAYMRPYRLNVSLPFRYDGFIPAHSQNDRDISGHTHAWFVLGEGLPQYIEQNDKWGPALLSYTKMPIGTAELIGTDSDAYEQLKYETVRATYEGWSDIKYDPIQEACYAFFRGVLYRFEDITLGDYRFSVILKTSEPILDDVFTTEFIQNDQFKTLTLVVNFYIPDPILTSLETGNENYVLDRSLLYFSNEILKTSDNSIDFDTDDISLRLYDRTTAKVYLGGVVTQDWYYNSNIGNIIYVARGDRSRFSTLFTDLFRIGDDFTINYTMSTDDNNPFYGMTITFQDMVEVTDDYFWCKHIVVKSNLSIDPDGVNDLNIADNVVQSVTEQNVLTEFLQNPLLFTQNNTIYISRAIAYENAIYDKIVNARANNARYKELSLANFRNYISNTAIARRGGDGNFLKFNILPPTEMQILVKLQAESGQLGLLQNPYWFPISRHSGQFKPITKLILKAKDSEQFSSVFPTELIDTASYRLNISKNVTGDRFRTEKYNEFIPSTTRQDHWSYISAITGQLISRKSLPWLVYPSEHKGFASLVFNSQEVITVTSAVQTVISLDVLLKSRVYSWLSLNTLALTQNQKFDLLNLYYDVTPETVDNYDTNSLIVRGFLESTFGKVYRIDSISTNTGVIVQFNKDSLMLTMIDIPVDATSLIIKFIR